ncbi:hypothetical protein [Iodidimonas gelatinilytica]|nr:hypothetical protein [Iodidimonas gelatinilytica]
MMFMSLKEIRTLGSILVLSSAALMAAPASSFAYQAQPRPIDLLRSI